MGQLANSGDHSVLKSLTDGWFYNSDSCWHCDELVDRRGPGRLRLVGLVPRCSARVGCLIYALLAAKLEFSMVILVYCCLAFCLLAPASARSAWRQRFAGGKIERASHDYCQLLELRVLLRLAPRGLRYLQTVADLQDSTCVRVRLSPVAYISFARC